MSETPERATETATAHEKNILIWVRDDTESRKFGSSNLNNEPKLVEMQLGQTRGVILLRASTMWATPFTLIWVTVNPYLMTTDIKSRLQGCSYTTRQTSHPKSQGYLIELPSLKVSNLVLFFPLPSREPGPCWDPFALVVLVKSLWKDIACDIDRISMIKLDVTWRLHVLHGCF